MKENKKIIKICFILILIIQVLAIIYATSKREYLHIDELTSYGLIQYHNAFLFKNEDFFNAWHNSDYFKDYLIINQQEKYDFSPIYNNQANDVHPPLYYLLLRIISIFNINKFSIWPGTILNIIIFILSSIILYLISIKIFEDKKYCLLVIILNGFSITTIENVMFLRMYQLLNLNVLLLIYWNFYKIKSKKINYKLLIPLFFIVLSGFLTHYYFLIFIFIIYLIMTVYYLKEKCYSDWIKYTCTLMLSGVIGIGIFPYSINHIFYTNKGIETFTSLTQNFQITLFKIRTFFLSINNNMFYGYTFILLLVLIILGLIVLIKKREVLMKQQKDNNIKYIIITILSYFFIVAYISPFITIRYIYPIVSFIYCILVYLLKELLTYILKPKYTFIVLLLFVIVFSLFGIQKLSNNSYTFKNYNEIISYMKKNTSNMPILMLYSKEHSIDNKMMDIFFVFLNSNETYILSNTGANSEEILDILKDVDLSNGLLFISYSNESVSDLDKILKTELFNEYKYIARMSVFDLIILK